MKEQALKGIKVVGFVTAGVGPLVTRSFAVNGASVVVVESNKRPNNMRVRGPFKDDKPGVNRSYFFACHNSDKYDMCLDLKHPRAKEVTRKLLSWADVFVDNWRPGVMESWNLSYEEARAIKPDIIMIGLTQQGQTGPHRKVSAYGYHLAGLGGFINQTGWPDRAPVSVGPYPDFIAPRFGTIALLAALDYRRRTGKGQYIDISQYENSLLFQIPTILDYTVNNRINSRNGNRSPYAAPHGAFRCKGNDKWCTIAVFKDSEWEAFCNVIGRPAWTQEPKFSSLAGRKEHEDELNQLVEKWTVDHTAEDVMMMMQEAGVPAGAVRNMGDIVEDCPQMEHRNFWKKLDHPEIGETTVFGNSYTLSKTPYRLERPSPCLGEHTEYVCREFLGISDEEFVDLIQDGVLN
ncbi:CaiB/BaiF CoA transferase family protein [Thermodesulfobacteriota bacterium]